MGYYIDEVTVTGGDVCPVCGADHGGYRDIDFSTNTITLSYTCKNCGAVFEQDYWLETIHVTKE